MRIVTLPTACILAVLGAHDSACAAEIYRWIDSSGVVHYSDAKPKDDTSVTTLEIADTRAADYDPATDPYSIRNQAKRINESWSALAAARAQQEAARTGLPRQASDAAIARDQWPEESWRFYEYPRGWWYYSAPPLQRGIDPGTALRQRQAIEGLSLTGPRAYSINSGAHIERVRRSTALPTVHPRGGWQR